MNNTPRTDALMDSITVDGAIPLHEAAKVEEFARALERLINAHNEDCERMCAGYGEDRCAPYVDRGRRCTDCPKDYAIDWPALLPHAVGVVTP